MTDVVTQDVQRETSLAPPGELEQRLEQHRVELTGYCYRMLGSAFEAEDAVQDTLVRAWRGYDRFEGRAALAFVAVPHRHERVPRHAEGHATAGPTHGAGPGEDGRQRVARPRPEAVWVEPMPDNRIIAEPSPDPADLAVSRDTIRLAFVAALQHLPPRQRAVLIFREVLRWRASEVAELLDTTVASVNSALQRARATLADSDAGAGDTAAPMDDEQRALLDRYVDAFERYDLDSLTALSPRGRHVVDAAL